MVTICHINLVLSVFLIIMHDFYIVIFMFLGVLDFIQCFKCE